MGGTIVNLRLCELLFGKCPDIQLQKTTTMQVDLHVGLSLFLFDVDVVVTY